MKTIQKGKRIRGQAKWWVGRKVACSRCHAVHIIEKFDSPWPVPEIRHKPTNQPQVGMADFTWSKTRVQFLCMTSNCGTKMLVDKDHPLVTHERRRKAA